MIRRPGPDALQKIQTLQHLEGGKALVEFLKAARQEMLEASVAVDEVRCRQNQGAALALGDLIALFERTPN